VLTNRFIMIIVVIRRRVLTKRQALC